MPSSPPAVFTPPTGSTPGSPAAVFTPVGGGGTPDAPGAVFTPPTAGGTPDAPGAVFTPPTAGGTPDAPAAVFVPSGSTAGITPETLDVSAVQEGPPDGTWMNGTYYRVADENFHPAWEIISGNNRAWLHSSGAISAEDNPWYYFTTYSRATAEDPWGMANTVFASMGGGLPWNSTFAEDGPYFGSPSVLPLSYVAPPPAIFTPA